jgi:hypothetical protein
MKQNSKFYKLIGLLVVMGLLFAALPTGQAQAETAIVLNTTTKAEYDTLDLAVTEATAGDTLMALVDFEVPAQVTIAKALTFNTDSHTITRNNATSSYDSLFKLVPGGDLTITGHGTLNSTGVGGTKGAAIDITGGKVTLVDATLTGAYASMRVLGNTDPATWGTSIPALFTMTGGNVTDSIVVYGHGAELSITGGVVTTRVNGFAPITGNGRVDGTFNGGGTKITVGGTAQVISPENYSAAIYHPQNGILIVNGGAITGGNGIEMKAGDLTVTGGAISGTGTFVGTPPATGNSSTDTGDAILVYSMPGYTGALNVDISGGTITSTNGFALREYTPVTDPVTSTRTTSVVVTGGIFSGGTTEGQAPESVFFTTVDASVLKLTGGAYQTDPGITPDYVYAPLDTYLDAVDNYYHISEMAVDDFYQTNQDTQLLVSAADGVLKNDTDVDRNNRAVSLITNVTHGVLTLYVDGSFIYMPNLGFYGNDTFIYELVTYPALTVADGWTDEATVTITVHEVPAPTFFLYLPLITK